MDTAINKLVSGRLKAQAVGPHPDPEILAAYAENALLRPDRERLLSHLAACSNCRDALYLAGPEGDTQHVLTPAYKPRRLAIRWATLAASVVIIGGALLTNRGIFNQHTRSTQPSSDAQPQRISELKTPPVGGQATEPQAPAIQTGVKLRPPLKHMTAKPQASMLFDQSGQVHFTSSEPASGANQAAAARADSAKNMISGIDWGLSADGSVQRSVDSGKTWQTVAVAGLPFRAISSMGNDVWVGGNAGALYHSADSGQSWTKVDPLSTDDIIRINFSDAQNGMLSTANGQVWNTSDGGRSWRSK
jgi:hypothetical protein